MQYPAVFVQSIKGFQLGPGILGVKGMWAITRGGFNQKLFNLPKTLSRPLMATSNFIRVSSPAYSTGSPNQAPSKHIGTHNGSFHCDEALGCFMIRLTDKFSNSEIVRSRDPKVSFSPSFFCLIPEKLQQSKKKYKL